MIKMKSVFPVIFGSLVVTIATQVNAQTPVPNLQDLVGTRGSSGEAELQN